MIVRMPVIAVIMVHASTSSPPPIQPNSATAMLAGLDKTVPNVSNCS